MYLFKCSFTAVRQRRQTVTSKKLLRFYFRAERLNVVLDGAAMRAALASASGGYAGEHYADRIITIIDAKRKLSSLWAYLNEVISSLSDGDRRVLAYYAQLQGGYSALPAAQAKAVRRVVVKFVRRARYLGRHKQAVELVGSMSALLGG